MTTTTNGVQSQESWRFKNPLRVWREKSKLLRADVAASTGISLSTVANMESGATPPTSKSYAKLAPLMGVDEVALEKRWRDWFAANPILHRAGSVAAVEKSKRK